MITIAFLEKAVKFDCLVVPVLEGKKFDTMVKELDELHGGLFSTVQALKDFEAKPKQTALIYTNDKEVPRVLLFGLGKKKDLTVRRFKQAIGMSVIALQAKKMQKLGYVLPTSLAKHFGAKKLGREITIAIETANYSYDDHKQKDSQVKPLKQVWFSSDLDSRQKKLVMAGVSDGRVLGESMNMVRQLANTPPSIMTPTFLANHAESMAKNSKKISVKVLSRPEMKKLKMGCLLGVSRGSVEEPKFIILTYNGGKKADKPSLLVGKGITFDSGGLSLKPSSYMTDMKFDMIGAATVMGIVSAAAALGVKKNIVGIIPTCENMPGGEAYRPDDILVAMNGKSVLVNNTDAEGRLILSDALSYATMKYKPKEVIDFATLTGACLVALGNTRSGLFSMDDKLVGKIEKASTGVGEQVWRLPIGEEYSEAIKCEIADVKNTGGVGHPRYGGASTAAAFLEVFTKDPKTGESLYPWAHFDLANCYNGEKGKPWIRGGANGFGVQTLIEYFQ